MTLCVSIISWPSLITSQIPISTLELWPLIYPKLSKLSLSFRNHIYWIIIKFYDNVCGYNILPKFVNSSIQIIQIDSRHLLSYYMPISLVYYYTGLFCGIWTLLFLHHVFVFIQDKFIVLHIVLCHPSKFCS